jgi:hypothetical protein
MLWSDRSSQLSAAWLESVWPFLWQSTLLVPLRHSRTHAVQIALPRLEAPPLAARGGETSHSPFVVLDRPLADASFITGSNSNGSEQRHPLARHH